jgi:hypothetical protein
MKIRQMSPADLIPYERNPRVHSGHQIEQIARSIKEFGFNNPILIDSEKGIIAGHGRLEAARTLGLKTVPVLELSHLTDAQKRAYIIADNKIALNSDWDYELLKEELQSLEADGFQIDLTGFSDAEFAAMMGQAVTDPKGEWDGMPEYEQDSAMFRSVIIHFHDQAGVDQFKKATGLDFTDTAKFAWYPDVERDVVGDKRVVSEE